MNERRDGPDEPIHIPEGQVQCTECGSVVPEEQALMKETGGDDPDIKLCPVCQ